MCVTPVDQCGAVTSTAHANQTGWELAGGPALRVHSDAPPSLSVPRPKSGTGVGGPAAAAIQLLSGALATLEPHRLTGSDAAELYGMYAEVERLSMAAKTLLAPRIDESGIWRDGGHRSSAVMLAELEGVPVGQARNTLEIGRRMPDLPSTEEALRSGTLSGPKVRELSEAAVLDPEQEDTLLAGAADQPLDKVKERCQRARVASERRDPVAAVRRIHADRYFTSWSDSEGAFCFRGRDTGDRGAKILDQMQYTVSQLRKAALAARSESAKSEPGRSESVGSETGTSGRPAEPESDRDKALRADAFFLLVTGRAPLADGSVATADSSVDTDDDPGPPDEHIAVELDPGSGVPDRTIKGARAAPPGGSGSEVGDRKALPLPGDTERQVIDRPPTCSLVVRVDLDALLRGDVEDGENCEIDNQGPIPVAMARDLASDSFLRLVFHRSGDIRAVSHLGRTINRRLRTALAHRDRCCVVPNCGVPYGLEIDHVVPFATGGPTELGNLALLCHHHHYLKTYEGWMLERTGTGDDGSPTWAFTPMPEFGQEPDPPGG
jgi:HNH endonuclease